MSSSHKQDTSLVESYASEVCALRNEVSQLTEQLKNLKTTTPSALSEQTVKRWGVTVALIVGILTASNLLAGVYQTAQYKHFVTRTEWSDAQNKLSEILETNRKEHQMIMNILGKLEGKLSIKE